MKFLTNIDLQNNQLTNAGLQVLSSAPTGFAGQIYYDTAKLAIGTFTGSAWTYDKPSLNSISVLGGPTANLAMGNFRITGLGLGIASTDAASVQNISNAIDMLTGGLLYKTFVRTVFTTNQSLSAIAALNDGVTLAVGDRFLLTAQSTATQNGPYLWQGASTSPLRAGDSLSNYELEEASSWIVAEGTLGTNQIWRIATTGTITMGATSVSILPISMAGTLYYAGTNVTITTGNFVNVPNGTFTKKYTGFTGTTATSTTFTDGLGTINKTWSLIDSSGNAVGADIQLTTTGAVVSFGSTIPTIVYTLNLVG